MNNDVTIARPLTQAPKTIAWDGKYFRIVTNGKSDPAVAVIQALRQRRWNRFERWWWAANRAENAPGLWTLITQHNYRVSPEAAVVLQGLGIAPAPHVVCYVQPYMQHVSKYDN